MGKKDRCWVTRDRNENFGNGWPERGGVYILWVGTMAPEKSKDGQWDLVLGSDTEMLCDELSEFGAFMSLVGGSLRNLKRGGIRELKLPIKIETV